MAVIDTVLLKVASRCNLDCTYCYVFNMGDDAWRWQPKRLEPAALGTVTSQLAGLLKRQARPFSVVLHAALLIMKRMPGWETMVAKYATDISSLTNWGEPLLLGARRLEELLSALRSELPGCGLHIQTNGLLLREDMVDVLVANEVGVSVSLDGPPEVNDSFRVDHRGRGSFDRIIAGVEFLRADPLGARLFSGFLAVVDPRSDPAATYRFFKGLDAPSVDFLYRDGNHDVLPFGKASIASTEYGEWMCRLLDVYLTDPAPPRIRVLDDLIRLVIGGRGQKEGVGLSDFGIVVIDTDGRIAKNDTLKSAGTGSDAFEALWSMDSTSLADVVLAPEFEAYHASQRPSSPVCLSCPELAVCGGGMPTHRWSRERGLANPTVFCADHKLLIGRVREWLTAHSREAA